MINKYFHDISNERYKQLILVKISEMIDDKEEGRYLQISKSLFSIRFAEIVSRFVES